MSSSFSSNSLINQGLNIPVSTNSNNHYASEDFNIDDVPVNTVVDLDNPLAEDALDFNQELIFDKQTPVCNEVEELIRSAAAGKATEKNRLVQNFCDFVYCKIWDSISTTENKNHGIAIYQMAANSYDAIIQNYPLKQEAQDNLFQYLPNQTWPEDFLLHMQTLRNKDPTAAWKNIAANRALVHPTDLQKTKSNMFGQTIIKAAGLARSYINVHLNRSSYYYFFYYHDY